MASPERARSLFLPSVVTASHDTETGGKNSGQGAKKNYLHDLEEHDKKVDEAAWESEEESGRPSRTSTIRAVEDFFQEYRPPSFRLKRISYLDKALPPPPPLELDAEDNLTGVAHVSDLHESAQTDAAVHNRHATRSSVSAPRRSSDGTRVSVRSRYSTQTIEPNRISELSVKEEWPRSNKQPSQLAELSRRYSQKQSRGSIPYRGTVLAGVDEEKEALKEKDAYGTTAPEKDPWLLEQTQGSLESDDIMLGNGSKGIGVTGDGVPTRSNSGVRKIVKTSSNAFTSFYNQCATSLEHRKVSAGRRRGSRTSEIRQAGILAGCFWSRDGELDDVA
ncbi:hypothetical protein P7C71_g534, partial [Lecanoromycetidae sp. Uapishka_2]